MGGKIHCYSKHFWISDGYAVGNREALLKWPLVKTRNGLKSVVYK